MPDKMVFDKETVQGLNCPEGDAFLMVYDSAVEHLGCKVSQTGKKVWVWYGRMDGKPVRKVLGTFPKMKVEDARKAALNFQDAKKAEAEAAAVEQAKTAHPVGAAMNEALARSNRRTAAQKSWREAATLFTKWLAQVHPDVTDWTAITRPIFREYLDALEARHCAPNTRRIYMNPMTQTARYMEAEYEFPDRCRNFKIGNQTVRTPSEVSVKSVLSFLEYLKAYAVDLVAPVALAGLAGMSIMEVIRLTWDKVDLKNGTVTVAGEIKNRYRERTIPVCAVVLDALKQGSEKPLSDHVASAGVGYHYDGGSWQNYGKRLGALLSSWRNDEQRFPGKDLRNCLPTLAVKKGVMSVAWEQYIGHSPRGVTATHYVSKLESKEFKTLVVDVVDAAVVEARKEIKKDLAKAKAKAQKKQAETEAV